VILLRIFIIIADYHQINVVIKIIVVFREIVHYTIFIASFLITLWIVF